jgi:hypothetical protein
MMGKLHTGVDGKVLSCNQLFWCGTKTFGVPSSIGDRDLLWSEGPGRFFPKHLRNQEFGQGRWLGIGLSAETFESDIK